MKKYFFILSLSCLSLNATTTDLVTPVTTVTTLHQDHNELLQKKVDAALAEIRTEAREKALRELYNEISAIIQAMETFGTASLADDTLLHYFILVGLENKINKAKRSFDFE